MWKLNDNVSKPDFRHWLDSVDLQLEAIHGFAYPDLVLEKVKRLPTEVTAKALKKLIADINEEHQKKIDAGGPPGIDAVQPGADPWQMGLGRRAGAGVILIDPSKWDFVEKSRWLHTYLIGN